MAIDTTQIGTVYDTLMTKTKETLIEQYDLGRIKADGLAQALSNTIAVAMQMAVQSVAEQPLKEQQITNLQSEKTIKEEQSAKDLLVKEAQMLSGKVQSFVALANSQKDVELKTAQIAAQTSDTAIKQAQSTAEIGLKTKQTTLVDKQIFTEVAKEQSIKNEDSIKSTQSVADNELKIQQSLMIGAQKLLVDRQAETEVEKKNLTIRQKTAYDDNKKSKKAEIYGQTVGMVYASGTPIDADKWTTLNSYISAV